MEKKISGEAWALISIAIITGLVMGLWEADNRTFWKLFIAGLGALIFGLFIIRRMLQG